jgi:hypothetical protein
MFATLTTKGEVEMRKLGLGLVALGVAVALLAASASVAQARSFTVFGVQQGTGHGDRNSFVFHQLLYQDGEHVGRNRIEISATGRRSADVKALFRFKGGKIRVAGPLGRGDRQVIPITGGKGRYHGISGRLVVKSKGENVDKETFHFSR